MVRSQIALRTQLLEASLRLFTERGFAGTSLRDIATEVGCSKASLVYHFGTKEAIIGELLMPTSVAAEELIEKLDKFSGERLAVAALAGFVDLSLRFRREMALRLKEAAEIRSNPGLRSLTDQSERLLDAVAGRSSAAQDRLRAWMVLGAVVVGSTVGPELPREELREELLRGGLLILGIDSAAVESN